MLFEEWMFLTIMIFVRGCFLTASFRLYKVEFLMMLAVIPILSKSNFVIHL